MRPCFPFQPFIPSGGSGSPPVTQVLFLAVFICPQKSPKEMQTKAGSQEPGRLTPDWPRAPPALGPESDSGPGHIPG